MAGRCLVAAVTLCLCMGSGARLRGEPQYTGGEACKTCHADIWRNFFKNPHFKSVASGKEPAELAGCEGCHGPGGGHIDGKGDKSKIIAFSALEPKQAQARCLSCHANTAALGQIRRSQHTLNQIVCTGCHSIHRAATAKDLLSRSQTDLCSSCHPNVKAQFSLPFKHRVLEGAMSCSDCHNPHGAPGPTWRMGARPRMVGRGLGNEEPCLKCHIEKRGPFTFEHAAVRVDGCEVCHDPHGSANARLLRRPAVFTLCLECHNGAQSFGLRGDGVPLTPPFHNMADPRYRNCTTCHVRIHGSNADARFLR
jgi:DmsE family decaheme c-type cytochrome